MRKLIGSLSIATMFFSLIACSDWTRSEAEQIVEYTNTEVAKKETYYAALREWKESEHSISFGWWGGWSEPAATTTNMLVGIPDSMDVVSLWGGWTNLSEGRKADLKFVQEKKGTKVVFCSFANVVGYNLTPDSIKDDVAKRHKFWGWIDGDKESHNEAVRKYARAFIDTLNRYNYDGVDIDFEPNYGHGGELASNNELMHVFITELGKYIGPMSPNPKKLLIVDGEPQTLNSETGPYISYFVIQAYIENESGLDRRLDLGLNKFKTSLSEETITNRYVMTENLESALDCLAGGYTFTTRDGRVASFKSLEGYARWQPLNGFRKGGCGGYHFDAEAVNAPSYKWMRNAIQVMNPTVK